MSIKFPRLVEFQVQTRCSWTIYGTEHVSLLVHRTKYLLRLTVSAVDAHENMKRSVIFGEDPIINITVRTARLKRAKCGLHSKCAQ